MEYVTSNTSAQTTSGGTDSSASILESLEHQLSVSLQAGNEIRTVRPNIAVEGVQLKQNTAQGDLSFAILSSDTTAEHSTSDLEDENVQVFKDASQVPVEKVETSIKLPKSLLNDKTDRLVVHLASLMMLHALLEKWF